MEPCLTCWNQAFDTQRWTTNHFSHNKKNSNYLLMPISVNAINFMSEKKILSHSWFLCYSRISITFTDFCHIHGFLSLVLSKNNIYYTLLLFWIHVMYLLIDILYINDKQTHSYQQTPPLSWMENIYIFSPFYIDGKEPKSMIWELSP